MCELTRLSICEDTCAECGHQKKGVRFRLGLDSAFLCWEHFRLLQAAMKPDQAVVEERVIFRGCSCHSCHHSCCCGSTAVIRRSRTWSSSSGESVCRSESESVCHTQGQSETRSESFGTSRSRGGSVGYSEGRSRGETRTHSSGHGRSETSGE